MKRKSDLIDVWFDSGAMPYAQIHYPFENKELLDSHEIYPADFIAEGVDQTRGWFLYPPCHCHNGFSAASPIKPLSQTVLCLTKTGIKCPND